MTSEGLEEVFKGDSADMCTGKFPLVSMGGRADTSSVRRRGARTPIGASGINKLLSVLMILPHSCILCMALQRKNKKNIIDTGLESSYTDYALLLLAMFPFGDII